MARYNPVTLMTELQAASGKVEEAIPTEAWYAKVKEAFDAGVAFWDGMRQSDLPGIIEIVENEDEYGNAPDGVTITAGATTHDNTPVIHGDLRYPGMAIIHDNGKVAGLGFQTLGSMWKLFKWDAPLTDGEHTIEALILYPGAMKYEWAAPITFTVQTDAPQMHVEAVQASPLSFSELLPMHEEPLFPALPKVGHELPKQEVAHLREALDRELNRPDHAFELDHEGHSSVHYGPPQIDHSVLAAAFEAVSLQH